MVQNCGFFKKSHSMWLLQILYSLHNTKDIEFYAKIINSYFTFNSFTFQQQEIPLIAKHWILFVFSPRQKNSTTMLCVDFFLFLFFFLCIMIVFLQKNKRQNEETKFELLKVSLADTLRDDDACITSIRVRSCYQVFLKNYMTNYKHHDIMTKFKSVVNYSKFKTHASYSFSLVILIFVMLLFSLLLSVVI
jgi:hypothetical protein